MDVILSPLFCWFSVILMLSGKTDFFKSRPNDLFRGTNSLFFPKGGAVVLGFLGSSPRILSKYGSILSQECGLDTLVLSPPMLSSSVPQIGKSVARKLASELSSGKLSQKERLVVLAMSGHGTNILDHLVTTFHQDARLNRLVGVVYDSAPVKRDAKLWSQATTAALTSKLPHILRPNKPVYNIPLVTSAFELLGNLRRNHSKQYRKWEQIALTAPDELFRTVNSFSQCGVPRALFLHSDSDKMAQKEFVEKYAQYVRNCHHSSCNDCVTRVLFHGLPHVGLLQYSKDKYVSALKRFIQKCMN